MKKSTDTTSIPPSPPTTLLSVTTTGDSRDFSEGEGGIQDTTMNSIAFPFFFASCAVVCTIQFQGTQTPIPAHSYFISKNTYEQKNKQTFQHFTFHEAQGSEERERRGMPRCESIRGQRRKKTMTTQGNQNEKHAKKHLTVQNDPGNHANAKPCPNR